ncbi:MAG: protein-L-isoaspartate(D-aspartate) O-methyltransferase [Ignavibacteriales bacterium]|nr:protein-L-isoaspartate(D-aspartate) O-methyltransferase [Ignavibacteriales bacterium]
MPRFDEERKEMVALLRQRGIINERILSVMEKVERHLFVKEPFINRAYDDTALPIAKQQTISQPYTGAFMTQELDPQPGQKTLEIGTGSGYQAVILAELGARVFTIERHMDLFLQARKLFERFGYRIATLCGDGTVGWSEFAPYDRIVVTAAAPEVPEPLLQQLADGGKLVIPVGGLDLQKLYSITKTPDGFERKEVYGFKFVPLIGKKGWNGK